MNVLRRGGAALLLVCSALGVALCLAGVVGVWVVHQPAKELVGATLDTLDSYLTLANQTVGQVRDRTTRLRATLQDARQELGAGGDAGRGAVAVRVSVALQEASVTLASLRNVLQTVSTGVASVSRALERLARFPSIVPPTLPADLQALEQSLGTIVDRVNTLGAALADASLSVASLTERIDAVSGELPGLDDRLTPLTARLATAQATLASAKASAATAIDLASVALSLLLLLFAAGQVTLGIQAWRWLRLPSPGASSGMVSPLGAGAG